ncbi:MAG: glycosyltransferase family 39 protein [Thermodesulfovibrionales bacterium]
MTRFFLAVLVIAIFVSFFRLGSVTLFDVDEAVFSEATKEMVQSGNWITPTYNGENRYDKPILFYWLMAVSYKIFGINEFSARFPSALGGFILCIAIFFFLREIIDEKTAFHAVLSLAFSIYFFAYAHSAVTDMVLTLFITLSLFSFYLSVEKDRRYLYGFYIFSALALLTKGLIGIIFPFGIAVVYLLIRDGLKGIKSIFNLKASVLFLLIALPWYIAQIIINGDEFIQQFLIKHHFKRYTGVISGHRGPIYYFIPAIIIGMFPWIAFLPQGIKSALKTDDRRPMTDDRLSKFKIISPIHLFTHSPNLFALIWFAFIFIFFSLSTTKLPNYILPAVPALSILISSGMTYYGKRWSGLPYIIIAILSLLLGTGFFVLNGYVLRFGIRDTGWLNLLAIVMSGFMIVSLYALVRKRNSFGILSLLMAVFLFTLSIKALPVANEYLQGSLLRYSLMAKERLRDEGELITYGINAPSIVYYSGRYIKKFDNKENMLRYLRSSANPERVVIISKAKDIEIFKDTGLALLETDGRYVVLERK